MDNLFDLKDKAVVITGSSRGIGRKIATSFAQRGAKVIISSRNLASCQIVEREIRDFGGTAQSFSCNIAGSICFEPPPILLLLFIIL